MTATTSTSVERAFELLETVAGAGRDGITLVELAATVPTAMSTTHRYVTTLLNLGVLKRDPAGRLRLGVRLIALAGSLLGEDALRSTAEPLLEALVEMVGETAHLGVPLGPHMVYVAKVESPHSVRLVSRIGARAPMHCTAMGKAVLAHLDGERRSAILAPPLEVRTPRTLTGDALLAELDRVRRQGFAVDDEENETGVRCLAAPVLTSAGEPVGAVSVSGPADRLSRERATETAPEVVGLAAEIARRLGHRPPRWLAAHKEVAHPW